MASARRGTLLTVDNDSPSCTFVPFVVDAFRERVS